MEKDTIELPCGAVPATWISNQSLLVFELLLGSWVCLPSPMQKSISPGPFLGKMFILERFRATLSS